MVYNLEELRKACLAGKRFKYIFFWGHTPAADGQISEACFSLWWPCRFLEKCVEFSCVEQFLMA